MLNDHSIGANPSAPYDLVSFRVLPDYEACRQLAFECRYNSRRLARHFRITQRHLQRVFKAQFQCSPQRWLREQRLLRARDMLRTSLSVKEVAYELGFCSASQFCRDYKSCFGQQPSSELPEARHAAPALVAALPMCPLVGSLESPGNGTMKW